jgi:S1-C subfamily serine protease
MLARMRWPSFLATGFALTAGFSGGFLFPRDTAQSEAVSIDRVAGGGPVDRTAGSTTLGATRQSLSIPDPSVITEEKPALEPLAKLTPQQIAKRALQWSASIRGDGVYGAGIVVDERGYVLTNHHVIQGLEKIRVQFVDTAELPAKVVEVDKSLDLALLKVELDELRPSAAPAGDFLSTEVGDDVFAIGSPRKMNFTMSRGMVSYVGRRIDGHYYLQSDLATNDGNSGGPVINDRGEVVAVMTFILRDSQGLAFAVPMSYAYERFAEVLGTRSARIDLGRFQQWRKEQDDRATASR